MNVEINEYGLNERIRTLRESLKLGRQEFCKIIGKINRQDLQNIELKRQRAPSWIIEKVAEIYPQYGYWIGTGLEIPEVGQISPMTEQAREELNLKVG